MSLQAVSQASEHFKVASRDPNHTQWVIGSRACHRDEKEKGQSKLNATECKYSLEKQVGGGRRSINVTCQPITRLSWAVVKTMVKRTGASQAHKPFQ